MMSFGSLLLRTAYKLSGAKKAFALPEDELLKAIEKANRGRGFFMPTDRKARYEKKVVNGFPCLIVRAAEKPARRAILFFFGGMVIGPDKSDAAVLRKLCYGTDSDVWFPIYPLCTEHCITESYDMAYECYRQMVALYGGGNVSTCGFSSGAALAMGMAAHNSALGRPLPQPKHIIAAAPGEVPWNDDERARMQRRSMRAMSPSTTPLWQRLSNSCATGITMSQTACSRPRAAIIRASAISTSITAPTRCSTARCRSTRPRVSGQTCLTP